MSALPKGTFDELAQNHRDWHTFDLSRSPKLERAALKRVQKTMDEAAACIRELFVGGPDITDETPRRGAWRIVGAIAQERGVCNPLSDGQRIADILTTWSALSNIAMTRGAKTKAPRSAVKMTASGLWCVRAPGFKCSATKDGAAVNELREIAKAAGDQVTPLAAYNALRATRPKRKR
jgi:hypothetical protein